MTKPTLRPYGELADGSFGIALDANNNPTAVAIEVLATLPLSSDVDNFEGRSVFSTADSNLFVYTATPTPSWIAMKTGQVIVDSAAPSGSAPVGTLYYSTTTEILYIYAGGVWVGIAGNRGSGVIWRHYVGDGLASLYPTGSGQMPPVEYVQVYINGVALQPGANGLRDYYMVGNDVQLATTPSTNAKISIRTLIYTNVTRNSKFFVRQYDTDGTTNSFETGSQLLQPGQTLVTLDGVVQRCDYGAGNGTYDYKILTQNNSVVSLTATGTTVTATLASAHGMTVGSFITIVGANQTQYNGTFAITEVVNSTTVKYTAGSTPSASPATGTMKFGPLTQNDRIAFYSATGVAEPIETGMKVYIQSIENINATI